MSYIVFLCIGICIGYFVPKNVRKIFKPKFKNEPVVFTTIKDPKLNVEIIMANYDNKIYYSRRGIAWFIADNDGNPEFLDNYRKSPSTQISDHLRNSYAKHVIVNEQYKQMKIQELKW